MTVVVELILCAACVLALAARRAALWTWALTVLALTAALETGALLGPIGAPPRNVGSLFGWVPASMLILLSIPLLRRRILVVPIFRMMRGALPRVSETARQALDSGTVGFEGDAFRGDLEWEKFRAVPPVSLTPEERSFLDGPTEDLCRRTDDWQIRHDRKEIPERIWTFLRDNGFFGLSISREHGGLGFSAQAVSLILGKIAARSPDVFTVVMVPNVLGPAELIAKYGTDEQKRRILPRLAKGEDIPCLAVTGPTSGSDAATMRDVGIVARGRYDGADTLGIVLTWDKRFTTLGPQATLIGLAFHLRDPENLLGRGEDVGITIALLPAAHPGVTIGRCHLPSGAAYPIGPTSGKDVFIPLGWVIGGRAMAGHGWRMLTECMAANRAVAVPAFTAAGAKSMLRLSTAYARIRRQFGVPIARMEALEEPLARMIEAAYVGEAGRAVTAAMVTRGEKPSVVAALMKYQMTERLRHSVNDAMDLHGGRAVCDGPANYLQSAYQMVPAAITIEGANIVTRALIAFTQAALRAHPYLQREVRACGDADGERGLLAFEEAFLGHIAFSLSNAARAFLHNLTGGAFVGAPGGTAGSAEWHRRLRRASRNFAFVADLTVVLLGAGIRTRQKLTGRLSDALSELYLLACVLKRHEDDGFPDRDRPIVAFAAQNGLHRFQEALRGTIDNFPIGWARLFMRAVVFPLRATCRPAPDRLGHEIVGLVLEPGEVRDRLTWGIHVSDDPRDPTGLLEVALRKVIEAAEAEKKLERAVRRGIVRRYHGMDWIGEAVEKAVIDVREAELLRDVEALSARVVAVDDFDPDEIKPNYMTAGHNARAAQAMAASGSRRASEATSAR